MGFIESAINLIKQPASVLIPKLGVFGGAVESAATAATSAIKSTAEKIRSYASDAFLNGGVIAKVTEPKPSLKFEVTPAGKDVVKQDIAKTPVGINIKVPFVQKEVTVPSIGRDSFMPLDQVIKTMVELPEKVVTSLGDAPEVIRSGKIPSRPTNQIFNVPTYAEDAQTTFNDFSNLGYTPKQAAAITMGLVGPTAVLDVATIGSFIESGTKSILRNVKPKDIEAESARQFMGLRKDYTVAEREAAYRELAKELHPDVAGVNGNGTAFAKVTEANTILKTAEEKGVANVWDELKQNARTVAEKLQTPVQDLFKLPQDAPYANIKGLLPSVAGTRPEPTYNPYRRFNMGLSVEDVTGGAKPLPKDDNIPPVNLYDEFVPKKIEPVPEKVLIPGQGIIDMPGKVTVRAVREIADEIAKLKTALYKNKAAFVEEYLSRPEGMQIMANADKFRNAPLEFDRRVVQGIKNSSYWKKELTINDEMGRGWMMSKSSVSSAGRPVVRYTVVEPTAVTNYRARGWDKVIEIDSLASEAGFVNGKDYLDTMMQLAGLRRFNNVSDYAHRRLLKIDPKYSELNKKITDLTKEVQALYGTEIEKITSDVIQSAERTAAVSPEEFKPGQTVTEEAGAGDQLESQQPEQGQLLETENVEQVNKENQAQKSQQEKSTTGQATEQNPPQNDTQTSDSNAYDENLPQLEYGVNPPPTVRGGIKPPALDFSTWNDKSALSINRETFERNIEEIAGKDAPKIKEFIIDPLRENETARVNFANSLREDLKRTYEQLGIKPRSLEDVLTQQYGEKTITLEELKAKQPERWQQIVEFTQYFRDVYDGLLTQWNGVRGKFGYLPIPKRTDYFRHFVELQTISENFGLILGANDLPTEISGITDIFRPGKPFSTAEIKRLGGRYTPSAIVGLDKYIDAVSKQIYHTESVQRVRALDDYARESAIAGAQSTANAAALDRQIKELKATPEYNNAEADLLYKRITPADWENLPVIKKMRNLQDKMRHASSMQRVNIPNFTANLRDYGDIIAGKKTRLDRSIESLFGRRVYTIANFLRSRFSANAVLGNLSSAMSNTIGIFTQVPATTGKIPFARGMFDTLKSPFDSFFEIDGVRSKLLTRRYPVKSVSPKFIEKVNEIAGFLFETTDKFAVRSAVAAKYYENANRGISKEQAMKIADEYVIRTFADRGIGERPYIHEAKSLGLVTNFQLEVNNLWSFMFKDIPKNADGKKLKLFSMVLQFMVFSYLFNENYKKITGRRATLDPIYYILTMMGMTDETQDMNVFDRVVKGLGLDGSMDGLTGQMPYIGGIFGGRFLPIAGTMPDFPKLADGIRSGDIGKIWEGVKLPVYFYVSPFGGSQIKKAVEGVGAVIDGNIKTASGGVKYTIEQTPGNFIRGLIFGKYAFPEGNEAYTEQTRLYRIIDEQTKKGLENRLVAEKLYVSLRKMDPQEANDYANALSESNPALYQKLVDVFDEHAKGFTQTDKLIGRLSVKGGERAQYIMGEINKLKTPDEKNAYFEDLDNKGLITDEVYDQIVELLEKKE